MSKRDTWLYWGLGISGFLALVSYRKGGAPLPSPPKSSTTPVQVIQYLTEPDGKIIIQTTPAGAWGAPRLTEKALPSFRAMVKNWGEFAEEASRDYRVPLSWIYAVMWSESGGDPKAESPAGALGLMQVMPMHFKTGENPLDPRTNLRRGASLLESARAKGPDLVQSASIYNAGSPPDGKGPWTNEIWLAHGRNPSLTTRWGFAAEPAYLDHVVAALNSYLIDLVPGA
jgi:soluble lytic murein transglycosylase-like protein